MFSEIAEQYNTEVLKLATSQTTLSTSQTKAIFTTKGLAGAELDTAIKTATMSAAEKEATISTGGLSAAFKGLWATLLANPWIGILSAMVVGTIAVVKTIDSLIVTTEEQIEINEKLKESYDALISEQTSLQAKLDETRKRIVELNAMETLSLVEQSELTNLRLQNTELSNRLALLKEESALKASELNNGIEKAYQKDFQSKDVETLEAETYKTGNQGGISEHAFKENFVVFIIN